MVSVWPGAASASIGALTCRIYSQSHPSANAAPTRQSTARFRCGAGKSSVSTPAPIHASPTGSSQSTANRYCAANIPAAKPPAKNSQSSHFTNFCSVRPAYRTRAAPVLLSQPHVTRGPCPYCTSAIEYCLSGKRWFLPIELIYDSTFFTGLPPFSIQCVRVR